MFKIWLRFSLFNALFKLQITLRVEVDPVTLAPSDRLDEGLLEWANCLGVHGLKTVADFLESSQNEVRLNTHPHIPVCCHGLGFNGVIVYLHHHFESYLKY